MLKQFLTMIILTAIAMFFIKEFASILHVLGAAQVALTHKIYSLVPSTHFVRLISNILTLVIIPFLLGLIPAFIYWLIERKELPKLIETVWVIWIILLLVFVLHT